MAKTKQPVVVITRARREGGELYRAVRAHGFQPYVFPTIEYRAQPLTKKQKAFITVTVFDYIIFTSSHAVFFFKKYKKRLQYKKVIAIGSKTKEACEQLGIIAEVIAKDFTAKAIVTAAVLRAGDKILLPHSARAEPFLKEALEKKGVLVCEIMHYTTILLSQKSPRFASLVNAKRVMYLTFMSPSAIGGFRKRMSPSVWQAAQSLPAVALGKETAIAARTAGFTHVLVAKEASVAGILAALTAQNKKNRHFSKER